MQSSTTPDFWRAYAELPLEVKRQARKAWRLWRANPRHSSLRFARRGSYWSVRVSRGWRAVGRDHEGTLYWFWIGPHDEYEELLKS
jgi:hypothetical protein